uniref:Uncharacterized protein n=1 Tax=Magallana gigas TaxID=29159 RepID=K1QBF8_MAGGI
MDTGSGYTTDTSSISTEPSEKRKVKQRPRKKRQRSSAGPSWGPLESDTEEDWKLRSVSTIWTMSRVKDYGLHYENKTSPFSDFYDLFKACDGKNDSGFIFPLEGEEKTLLETLVDQTNLMIDQYGVERDDPMMWSSKTLFNWVRLKKNCKEAVKNLTQNIPTRRGMRKSVLEITGKTESSVPDLRLTNDTAMNLFVIEVMEVKQVQCNLDESVPFNINNELNDRLLGHHARELLIDYQKTSFGDLEAAFGIICLQTSIIFTCLKMSLVHYANIQQYGTDLVSREIKGDDSFRMLKDESDEREEEGFNYKKSKRRKVVLEQATEDGTDKEARNSIELGYARHLLDGAPLINRL